MMAHVCGFSHTRPFRVLPAAELFARILRRAVVVLAVPPSVFSASRRRTPRVTVPSASRHVAPRRPTTGDNRAGSGGGNVRARPTHPSCRGPQRSGRRSSRPRRSAARPRSLKRASALSIAPERSDRTRRGAGSSTNGSGTSEDRLVAGLLQIGVHHERKPEQVVGDLVPEPDLRHRVPPVVDGTIGELMPRVQQELLPGPLRDRSASQS